MEKTKNFISWWIYAIYGIFSLIIFLIALKLPTTEIVKIFIATPGVGALIFGLWQIMRDNEAHRRALEIQEKGQDFILGTATHMADVVYDKHVLFCEEYMKRTQEGLQELFKDGPSHGALTIGGDLVRIRIRHKAWLTKEIEKDLKPFEDALIKMGAGEGYLSATRSDPRFNDERKKIIDEIYNSLGLVLGHQVPKNDEETLIHVDTVTEKIRNILGIEIITKLRLKISRLAISRDKD